MAGRGNQFNKAIENETVTRSCGNVFEDIGLPNPKERLAKAQVVSIISNIMSERRLSQTKTAKLVGVDQPTLSKLLSGSAKGFTLDRLFEMLAALGQDVDINVRPHSEEPSIAGRIAVERI